MGEALEHQPHEIHGYSRRSQKRDLHDAALHGGGFIIAADVIATDHVEDQLDAGALSGLLGQSDKIFRVVIDGEIGAEPAAGVAFLQRAGSYDDAERRTPCRAE